MIAFQLRLKRFHTLALNLNYIPDSHSLLRPPPPRTTEGVNSWLATRGELRHPKSWSGPSSSSSSGVRCSALSCSFAHTSGLLLSLAGRASRVVRGAASISRPGTLVAWMLRNGLKGRWASQLRILDVRRRLFYPPTSCCETPFWGGLLATMDEEDGHLVHAVKESDRQHRLRLCVLNETLNTERDYVRTLLFLQSVSLTSPLTAFCGPIFFFFYPSHVLLDHHAKLRPQIPPFGRDLASLKQPSWASCKWLSERSKLTSLIRRYRQNHLMIDSLFSLASFVLQ